MSVDPSQLVPPPPGALPGGAGLPPGAGPMPAGMPPGAPAGPPPDPSTDPNAVLGVLQAMQAQGHAQLQQQQDQAAAQGVAMMIQQTANIPGQDATTMPGSPVPPAMPSAPGAAGAGSGSSY